MDAEALESDDDSEGNDELGIEAEETDGAHSPPRKVISD